MHVFVHVFLKRRRVISGVFEQQQKPSKTPGLGKGVECQLNPFTKWHVSNFIYI
jgi:hypothetical protein